VPLALVGAELASGWPEGHGVYDWVRVWALDNEPAFWRFGQSG